jgi:hypothetical protein
MSGARTCWLDRPNALLDEEARSQYARLGLPIGAFRALGTRRPSGAVRCRSDTGGRQEGIKPYLWTMREFA